MPPASRWPLRPRVLPDAGMSGSPGTSSRILTDAAGLSDSDLRERLRLQFRTLSYKESTSQVNQLIEAHTARRLSLDHSISVSENACQLGVLTIAQQADGTINLWPASLSAGVPAEDVDQLRRQLYSQAIRVFDASGCWIAQCLLAPQDVAQSRELEAVGIPRLTELSFLARSLEEPLPAASGQHALSCQEFDARSNHQRFANLLERTWQGTLDCPELNGCRSGVEALDGHRIAGEFSAERWLLFSIGHADVGVLLLTDHPDEEVWEVVYFGVASEARGQGLGRVILLEGLRRARRAGALEVVLAVDVRNIPALKLYQELGFRPFDRRVVHALLRKPASS
jgi:mycothiol synthase